MKLLKEPDKNRTCYWLKIANPEAWCLKETYLEDLEALELPAD